MNNGITKQIRMAHSVQQCGLFSLFTSLFTSCSLGQELLPHSGLKPGASVIFTVMIVMMYFQGGPKSLLQLL